MTAILCMGLAMIPNRMRMDLPPIAAAWFLMVHLLFGLPVGVIYGTAVG